MPVLSVVERQALTFCLCVFEYVILNLFQDLIKIGTLENSFQLQTAEQTTNIREGNRVDEMNKLDDYLENKE